jgi:hypothetical protein
MRRSAATADLCAAFFRRAFALLRPGGRLGMIATNSIGQGDTRESGLKVILAQGGRIAFARRFVRWPGQASVEVNLVVIEAPRARRTQEGTGGDGGALLDDRPVAAISSRLDAEPDGEPARLRQNEGKGVSVAISCAASASCWRRRRRRRCWRATRATLTASSPT